MTLLIGLVLRVSIVLAAGLLGGAALARQSAALRHRVLALSLAAALLVIPVSLLVPGWTVMVPVRIRPSEAVSASSSTPIVAAATAAAAATPGPAALPVEPGPDIVRVLIGLWLLGAAIAGALLLASVARVYRLGARSTRVDDRRWLAALDLVATRYGLTRPVEIRRTDSPELLATWGLARPRVFVPSHAHEWTADRVHIVLAHELAHIRRHDWLVQMAAEALRVALWFNPLAWLACIRLRRESEQSCDDEVLGAGVSGRDYASHLLELARSCRQPIACASAMPMAQPSTLERRIAAMLNPALDRRPPSRRVIAIAATALLLVSLPVAALRARQAGPAPLSGTIYDVTGAVMPGVEVVLVDANDIKSVVATDAGGRFQFPPVAAGSYRLEVAIPGFRSLHQEFQLRTPADWNRAVTLQVGELKETIHVRETRTAAAATTAAAAAGGPKPVRVGGNIKTPMKTLDVKPIYPASMRAAGLSGVVPVEAIIGRDGTVTSVRVLSAQVHPDFAIAAVDAVRQWRFTPTLLNGNPVEVVMTVTVTFDLEG